MSLGSGIPHFEVHFVEMLNPHIGVALSTLEKDRERRHCKAFRFTTDLGSGGNPHLTAAVLAFGVPPKLYHDRSSIFDSPIHRWSMDHNPKPFLLIHPATSKFTRGVMQNSFLGMFTDSTIEEIPANNEMNALLWP